MASGEGRMVCVTGASGYIATWLTKLLLQRGYTVRATIRNLKDKKKTEHLLALDGANERLHLFEADLLIEVSFDSAIDGCEGVFHTASPCHLDCKDPQGELIDPAVKGTINVLTSCGKSSSVKRVVLTSSVAAMFYSFRTLTPDTVADETWFSDPQYCTQIKQWYILAKTLAEEAAWKFVKEKGIDMVTINPGLTLGSLLQPTLNFSSAMIVNLIHNEANGFPNTSLVCVHVEEVARAHVLAFENPSASGRYPVVESYIHISDILRLIRELYPTVQLPEKCVDATFPDSAPVSKEKAKTLGMDSYIPLNVGLKETIESLKERKLVAI